MVVLMAMKTLDVAVNFGGVLTGRFYKTSQNINRPTDLSEGAFFVFFL